MISVESLNAAFPKYPVTMEDKGWIYGVWYCSNAFRPNKFYGQYPGTFLKRALALFPDAKDILHAPSGSLVDVPGTTLDSIQDEIRKPMVVADCRSMPFPNGSFDFVLSDPPYSDKDSKIYGCQPIPHDGFHAGGPSGVAARRASRNPSYKLPVVPAQRLEPDRLDSSRYRLPPRYANVFHF